MKHYRDITSFHSIGKVLDGKPEHQNNVVDFLNFLSQVVFCDQISVSVLGPKAITGGTLDVINKLEMLGIPKNLIDRYSYPESGDRILQRSRISKKLMHEWLINFPILGKGNKECFPPGYYEMLDNTVDIFSDSLLSNQSSSYFQTEITESLNDDNISYMVGLMLSDPNLVEVIRYNFKHQNVGKEQIYDFIAMSRNKYNLLLSEDLSLAFTPSASRALNNQDTAYSFMDTYQKALNQDPREEMKKLRLTGKEYQLPIPSALHLLLSKNTTSVNQLIDRALEAREKLSWYRKEILTNFNELRFSNNIEDQIKLSNLLDSTYNDVSSVLSSNSKGLVKGVFGHFSWDLTSFSGLSSNGKAVWAFIKHVKDLNELRQRRECYMLTQELIHYMSRSENEYKKSVQELFINLGGDVSSILKENLSNHNKINT